MGHLKKTIYSNQDTYVQENIFYRWLCFDDEYIQTIISKRKPHRPILKYLPSLCLNLNIKPITPCQIVMLGAGAGAIYHYLKYYHPEVQLDLVEKDKKIITIAYDFFDIQQPIIECDAFSYIKNSQSYEHIFIDIFINQELPEIMSQIDFIKQCKIKTHNCVSINLLSTNHPSKTNHIIHLIREVFNQKTLCLFVKKKSNIIIHAFRQDNYLDHIKQLTIDKYIKKPQWSSEKGLISTLNHGWY